MSTKAILMSDDGTYFKSHDGYPEDVVDEIKTGTLLNWQKVVVDIDPEDVPINIDYLYIKKGNKIQVFRQEFPIIRLI